MPGKNVEMTYLWEVDISFFTSESPFPSVQDSFWRLGKRVSFVCGSLSRVKSGRFHRGTFSDTQKQKQGDGKGETSLMAFSGEGADQGTVLQLGTSLAAPRLPLPAAKIQECCWVRIFPEPWEGGHRARHPGRVQCLSASFTSTLCLHCLYSPPSIGFIP